MSETLRFPDEADIITKRIHNENPERTIHQENFYLEDGSGVAIRLTDFHLPESHPHHVLFCGFIPNYQLSIGLHTLIDNEKGNS